LHKKTKPQTDNYESYFTHGLLISKQNDLRLDVKQITSFNLVFTNFDTIFLVPILPTVNLMLKLKR